MVGADDHIGESIAVDVPGGGHRVSARIVGRLAVKPEAIQAIDGGKVELRAEAGSVAKHHVAGAGGVVSVEGADDQVIKPVAVDVPCVGDRTTGLLDLAPDEFEPGRAVEAREVDIGRILRHAVAYRRGWRCIRPSLNRGQVACRDLSPERRHDRRGSGPAMNQLAAKCALRA